MADKRNELINIPIYLLSDDGLLHYIQTKNWIAGLFIGISFFLFLFNLFLYLNMRDRLYIYYGIYITLGFMYIFSDMGFTFMYFFPDNPLLSDYTRPISITLATPVYLLFTMELLETRKHFPVSYKWMLRLLLGYVFLLIASVPLAPNTGSIRVVLSGISYVVLNTLLIANLLIGWKSLRKKISYSIYIIIASVVLMILLILFSLFLSGGLPDTFFNRNMMRIAITSEIGILTLVLSHRFKKYKITSEALLRQVNEQQVQIFARVSDYQEKELQRLSSLLHDSVGARLSALRFNLEKADIGISENKQVGKAINEINELANEVRRFSHDLSPVLLQKNGLGYAIEQFLHPINETGKLSIQFETIGSQHRIPFRYELLVFNLIQELVQNIIKHANASEAIIQLVLEDGLVSIYVEDNGIGFNKEKIKEGLGFIQIKQLVTFVNGSIQMDAAAGKGSRISIEFTTIPDDSTYPDSHS
jgi:signal transduction histidine kinase